MHHEQQYRVLIRVSVRPSAGWLWRAAEWLAPFLNEVKNLPPVQAAAILSNKEVA